MWLIKEGDLPLEDGSGRNVPPCRTGDIVKCGSIVRLEHMNTGRNLHSHAAFESPVSRR